MRRTLAVLAAAVLAATPAAAQRSGPAAPAENNTVAAATTPAPSLFPTTDEVRAEVRASEEARASRRSAVMTERDWLYLVAAIAVGVIIAAVVLD